MWLLGYLVYPATTLYSSPSAEPHKGTEKKMCVSLCMCVCVCRWAVWCLFMMISMCIWIKCVACVCVCAHVAEWIGLTGQRLLSEMVRANWLLTFWPAPDLFPSPSLSCFHTLCLFLFTLLKISPSIHAPFSQGGCPSPHQPPDRPTNALTPSPTPRHP